MQGPVGPQGPKGDTGPAGPPGPPGSAADLTALQSQIDALQALVNSAFQIDSSGNLTLSSTSNLILQPGVGKTVKTVGNVDTTGNFTIEGRLTTMKNAMFKANSTTMGNSMTRGKSMLMGDVTAMKNANVRGFLSLPDGSGSITNNVLTASGSSVTISGYSAPLIGINTTSLNPGAELTINFNASQTSPIGVENCFCIFAPPFPTAHNIHLKSFNNILVYFHPGVLKVKLDSNGVWNEETRTDTTIYSNSTIYQLVPNQNSNDISSPIAFPLPPPPTSPSLPVGATLALSSTDVFAGSPETISGTGFPPNAHLTITVDGTTVGDTVTTSSGTLSSVIQIPLTLNVGSHIIVVNDVGVHVEAGFVISSLAFSSSCNPGDVVIGGGTSGSGQPFTATNSFTSGSTFYVKIVNGPTLQNVGVAVACMHVVIPPSGF